LNTGGHNETETKYVAARQIIFHDKQHPSHIILPAIPHGERKER
jgi:predicted acyl esterase